MSVEKKKSKVYSGDNLNHVAFPLGGIGAGMICIEGTGALSHFSVRNRPNVFNEPFMFSALSVSSGTKNKRLARLLEGPVLKRKIFGVPEAGNGLGNKTYGFPRFSSSEFSYQFPFAKITLKDQKMPLDVKILAWSPFIPNDADNSSMPFAALEYSFRNTSSKQIRVVYSFNSENVMKAPGQESNSVKDCPKGFVLFQSPNPDKPWDEGAFYAKVDAPTAKVDCQWFRGAWFDARTILWKNIAELKCVENKPYPENEIQSPGGSLYVPFALRPEEEKTVKLMLSWYVPESELRVTPLQDKAEENCKDKCSCLAGKQRYKPWYSAKFADIYETAEYLEKNYSKLRKASEKFSACFYDSTLPSKVLDAVAANLTILKSPTVLRQADGRLWVWEGCCDSAGCCAGSCTHVWNYAQALPHLFPKLERSLRETEFFESQDENGHQNFRSAIPIGPTIHDFHAAADGQLGGIIKLYRDWRISGDAGWLKKIWPKAKKGLAYCIETWDPDHNGIVSEPHHNTYDIEFWGPDGMCGSIYLGALKAASLIGKELGEDVSLYETLYKKGRKYLETELYNGEYFFQKVQWTDLRASDPVSHKSYHANYSKEALELLKKEGPKYQYGTGCLSDGVIGEWLAQVCGIGHILDEEKVKNHLNSVYKYNFKKDLSCHSNPQRPGYAVGKEGGLLLCTWPKGGELSLPFVYSNEVWTGIEYQVASHLMTEGMTEEGLDIVKTCRSRYDGTVRNPFNEYECGHWYARAMASYALLYGLTGIRYDAVEKTLYINSTTKKNFRSFICTAGGYGTAGIKDGKPFIEVVEGKIEVAKIKIL